jgi:type I restriction enzyme, S subunit
MENYIMYLNGSNQGIELRELIILKSGRDLSQDKFNICENGVPYIMGASNINEGKLLIERWTDEPTVIGEKGDIILSVKGTVGELAILKEEKVHLSRQVMALRTKEKLDTKYLYYYLLFQMAKLKDKAKSMIPGITREDVLGLKIDLKPLNRQKQIVKVLDKAQSLIDKQKEVISMTDELVQSVFLEMFGNPLTNPKRIATVRIQEMGQVLTGNTPSRKVLEYYGSFIEWIKSDNINTPYHFITQAEEYLSEEGAKKGRIVPKDSILVTCIAGSKDCIGNVALTDRTVAFNQQINAIVPYNNVNPFFLYTQILIGKQLIQRASTNGMKGIVSKGKFEKISLMNPPFEIQEQFGSVFRHIETQKRKMQKSCKKLEENFNSLLLQSFSK